MLHSMTGYGQHTCTTPYAQISVTVQTLNAKGIEISFRLPRQLQDQELAWRKAVTTALARGKVNVQIVYDPFVDAQLPYTPVDTTQFKAYYQHLQQLAQVVGEIASDTLFSLTLQGIRSTPQDGSPAGLSEEEVQQVQASLQQALRACKTSREVEGQALAAQLMAGHAALVQALADIEPCNAARLARVRKNLRAQLVQLQLEIDENRFEQELVYHLDKLDIMEEQVRLQQHLTYFETILTQEDQSGKKLGFVVQEMGREVNTIGAKANDAALQQHVVQMKDILGQMKEQLANVL